jgi:hypothetical protein
MKLSARSSPAAFLAAFVLAAFALGAPALGSQLLLGGQPNLTLSYGQALTFTLSGAPNKPAFVYYDVSPGPVSIAGELIPLGLTPLLTQLGAGSTGPSGVYSGVAFLPEDPFLAGVHVYCAGVVVDTADPNGLDVSNGATLTIAPPVGAGADQATFVGRKVVLDGSAAFGSATQPPAGMTFLWQLVQKPAGSNAGLSQATSPFALFTPDLPGDYRARLSVALGGALVSDESLVHVYRLALTPDIEASYAPFGGVTLAGNLYGPAGATLELEGALLPLSGTSFGPTFQLFDFNTIVQQLDFEVRHPDGTSARLVKSLGFGSGAPLASNSTETLCAQLNQSGLDLIEGAAVTELKTANLAGLLLAQPPVQVANDEGLFGFTIFSAYVDFTSLTWNPNTISLQLTPAADGLHGIVRIYDVHANFDVWGELLEIDYSLDGSIATSPTEIAATVKFNVVNGQLVSTITNVAVTRYNFDFDLNGFLGDVAQLFVIESSVKADVESAIASAVQSELGPALEEILSAYVLAGNLYSTLEVDVGIQAPFAKVVHSNSGVTLRLNGKATALTAEPGSPPLTQYLSTPSAAPVFGALTPGGQPYGAAVALADDFLNQVLAASTAAGLLDGDLSSLLAAQGGIVFTTDVLAPLFPGAGFELFPSGTAIQLQAHGAFPPLVRTTPGQPAVARVELGGLQVTFNVLAPQGTLPWLVLSLSGGAAMNLNAQPDGTLAATLSNLALAAKVLEARAGTDPAILSQGLDFLTSLLLPQLSELIGAVPLPSLEAEGLALSPQEIKLVGGNSEYAGFYGQLSIVPGP